MILSDYHTYDHFGRENMVIDELNTLRSYHNNFLDGHIIRKKRNGNDKDI